MSVALGAVEHYAKSIYSPMVYYRFLDAGGGSAIIPRGWPKAVASDEGSTLSCIFNEPGSLIFHRFYNDFRCQASRFIITFPLVIITFSHVPTSWEHMGLHWFFTRFYDGSGFPARAESYNKCRNIAINQEYMVFHWF